MSARTIPNELPWLVLPGDRVMVDMNDPSVHKDSQLNGGLPDIALRHPEVGRHRDSVLDQLLLDHIMAERLARRAARATATGDASNDNTDLQLAARQEQAGPRWEPAVVLGSSRGMLALNVHTGDRIYVFSNKRTKVSKAFNDISMIHTCFGCKSRMRVPRPCDVLICFQCKTKIHPPPGSLMSARSSSKGGRGECTDLPLRAIAPMSPGDFVGRLAPGDEVEVQVVYKHAHRAAGRAWVMAKVVGRAKWAGTADVLQLMVPYPKPSASTSQGAGPRGLVSPRNSWLMRDVPTARQVATREAGASGTSTPDETADPQPTLELPAGNRFGPLTVELPSIDNIPSPDQMPDPVPILVSTDLTLLCERAVRCQQIARDRPHDLAEMHIMVSDPPSPPEMPGTAGASDRTTMTRVRSMRTAVVLSFVPGLQRHVVAYSEQEVKLIDLKSACFILEPSTTRVYHPSVLGKPGTHIKDCPVCFEPFDWSSLGRTSMSCHPRECCSACLSSWAEGQIAEGRLYVRCPAEGCKKQLALNQVKQIVDRSRYNSFVSSIREVHREAARAEQHERTTGTEEEQKAFREWVKKMDVRFCVGCFARIEKNKGCSHMTCWRCGTEFQWETAPPVSGGLPEAEASANGGGGANAASAALHPSEYPANRSRMGRGRPNRHSRSSLAVTSASESRAGASTVVVAPSLSFTDDEEEEGPINPVERRSIVATRPPQPPRLDFAVTGSPATVVSSSLSLGTSTSSGSAASGIEKDGQQSPTRRRVPSSHHARKRPRNDLSEFPASFSSDSLFKGGHEADGLEGHRSDRSDRLDTSSNEQGQAEAVGRQRSPQTSRRSSRTAANAAAPAAGRGDETGPRRYATRATRQKHVAGAIAAPAAAKAAVAATSTH